MNTLNTPLAEAAVYSCQPEALLIEERRASALHIKYHRELTGSWEYTDALLRGRNTKTVPEPDPSPDLKTYKQLGGLMVEQCAYTPVTAYDTRGARVIRGDSSILLHANYIDGPGHLREQLALAGRYVASNPELAEQPYVLAVTFQELGRLAVAVAGMRPMEVVDCDPDYRTHVQAAHMTFSALNGRREREFKIAAVYLPTEEFIA